MVKCIYILICYLLGSISPAAFISRMKRKNLREHGTKNLGATNTMLVFGKRFGVVVMLFDVSKGFFAYKIATWITPETKWLAMAAGTAAVVGHCYPFYLKFKGGKGLASFGGMVLAYNPILFLCLLLSGVVLMLIINHGVVIPLYASVFFVMYVSCCDRSLVLGLFATLVSFVLLVRHTENFVKAFQKQDTNIRNYIKTKLFSSNKVD